MFGLTYLPEKDIQRQIELQEELKSTHDLKRIPAIHKELAALAAKRKPIIDCNLEETTELKVLITKKLQMVSSTGKKTQAEQFIKMLKMLDDRILVLSLERKREEKEKAKKLAEAKEKRIEEAKETTRGVKRGKGPPRARSGKSRWTTGFDKID